MKNFWTLSGFKPDLVLNKIVFVFDYENARRWKKKETICGWNEVQNVERNTERESIEREIESMKNHPGENL